VLDRLVDLLTSGWAYLVVAAAIVVDAVVGVIPSEALLHVGGVLASRGDLALAALIAVAAAAAVCGDLLTHTLGRTVGARVRDRLFRGERARRRLERAREELDERPWILTVARFVPGLRTAATFSAGSLGMPRLRFVAYVAPGAVAWAS
jgi:membrane protein DedA with SNARE-associated domain